MSYIVAVRALCEFAAKAGDLDLRFTPAPTALEGIEGHAAVTARRGDGYESEIALSGAHRELTVRGRADGYDTVENRLEEIKTYRGELDAMPANHRALHWAQAFVYGHLLCQARGLDTVRIALVYFDVVTRKETLIAQDCEAAFLQAFFNEQCERFLGWASEERIHRDARNAALRALRFPYANFRRGQRELAVAVYRAARDGQTLMAQAPTGIGKTLATLFPALKACGEDRIERVFYLTAKTSGRALALEAIDSLHASAGTLPLRTLELIAKEKACEHRDKACHGESCPLARGFYDRLDAARRTALARCRLDHAAVREAALAHEVCPYYLSLELVRWTDVVIGDYNYYYDGSAVLYALARMNQWRVAVLVDEAHNLLERARGMYTVSLGQASLRKAIESAPAVLKRPLQRLRREWQALNRERTSGYEVYSQVPARLLNAAQDVVGTMVEHLGQSPQAADAALLQFFFDVTHFVSLAEQFGDHSIFDLTSAEPQQRGRAQTNTTLCVRNVLPAPFLSPRHAAAHTTVLFSGTLRPHDFYRDTLGLPVPTRWIEVEGPFRAEQLTIHIAAHVSTRWRDRERSLAPIAELIAQQYTSRPGNYFVFLSSFDYLERLAQFIDRHYPQLPMHAQVRAMDEAARDAFIARFRARECGADLAAGGESHAANTMDRAGRVEWADSAADIPGIVGLAVLGGAFAEGIDLVGDQLIGAFIATLGLPQVNDINEQMRRAMEAKFGDDRGYDYVYLYPGLQKVVQAAGRVVRSEADSGVLHLMDDRFRRPEVRRLLPSWWRLP